MDECPHCQRRLLSKASARCNWCGKVIEDASYQQAAQTEREAYYRHEAERDALALARTDSINVWEYGIGSQVFRPSVWRKPIPKSIEALTGGTACNSAPGAPDPGFSQQPTASSPGPRFGTPLNADPVAQPVDGNLVRPWYADDTKSDSNRFTMRTAESPTPTPEIENLINEDSTVNRTGRFEHLEIDQKLSS